MYTIVLPVAEFAKKGKQEQRNRR